VTALELIFGRYRTLNISSDDFPVTVEIRVEDRLRRPIRADKPYYSIGWHCEEYLKYPIALNDNDKQYLFAWSKPLNQTQLFTINTTNSMVVLHFSPEIAAFKNKVVLYDMKNQCYNHTQFKMWKNLENGEVISGLKVTQEIARGFKLVVKDYQIEGTEGVAKALLREYEKLPVEVKVVTRVMQTVI
jgi:hypothetical protein